MSGTHPRPWGYRASLYWYVLVVVLSALVAALAIADRSKPPVVMFFQIIIVLNAVQIGALAFVARLAHWPPGEYLGLVRPNKRDTVIALASLALFVPGSEALGYLLGTDATQFRVQYLSARTSGALPLLWFASLVAAPVGEEIMYRGFLFRCLTYRSQRHVLWWVATTSILWALTHIQYDWVGQMNIFLLGLLFGWVRWRSGSTILTMLMHGLFNLWATLATAYDVA